MKAPPPFKPRTEPWPDALRTAWAALSIPEQRLMLRARLEWRSWPNPGPTPPRPPQYRVNLREVTALLYAIEREYRAWSACRGGTYALPHTHSAAPREQGRAARSTPDDALRVLASHPDGMTVTELNDHLPDTNRRTLTVWLARAERDGHAHSARRGAAYVWQRTVEAP